MTDDAAAGSRGDLGRTIGTILVPLIRKEIDALVAMVASMPRPTEGALPGFAVAIDRDFADADRAHIEAAFAASALRDARIRFLACGLAAEESFYLRTTPETFDAARFPYGCKSGPNKQFFTSLRRLLESGPRPGSVLLMETDAFALAPFWLDRINRELERVGPFLVAGSPYRGLSELPPDIEGHINGNAVYALSDPRFPQLLATWERALLEVIPSVPWQAYDVMPEWAKHHRPRTSAEAGATAFGRLAAMAERGFVPLRSIANFAGGYEASASLGEAYPGFRSLRDIEVVHLRVPAGLRRRLEAKKRIEVSLDTDGDTPALAADAEASWQYPTVTELTAFRRAEASLEDSPQAAYLGLPWATLIDRLLHRPDSAAAFAGVLDGARRRHRGRARVVTVCQHVHMLDFLYLFERAGVTDIFWSHAAKGVDFAVRDGLIKLHPFPLYPVQRVDGLWDEGERRHLFSFVGTRGSFYPSPARALIFDLLADDPRGVIVGRDRWHYDGIVHDQQIRQQAPAAPMDEDAGARFRDMLLDSIFSLCPAGSGPNSIRLWESIAAGSIPVVLADQCALPGPQSLWQAAAVFCPETRDAVTALPDRLEALARDPAAIAQKRRALRQLWLLYGPDTFIYDIQKLWLDAAAEKAAPGDWPLDWSALSDLAERVQAGDVRDDERALFLAACASRSMLDRPSFDAALERYPSIARAHGGARPAEPGRRSSALAEARAPSSGSPADRPTRKRRLEVCLLGRHATRLPLACEAYRPLFAETLDVTDDPESADLIVVGFSIDVKENAARIRHAIARRPGAKIVVLSEEPLWDTVWSGAFHNDRGALADKDGAIPYHNINHANSAVYGFARIPYFVTTNDNFFLRYSNLFGRNRTLAAKTLLEQWEGAAWRAAFYAERRLQAIYDVRFPDLDIEGLCTFRTRIAEALGGPRIARVGQGWADGARRQDLPDWHLDKLAALDRRAFIVSGIENTHQRDYVTEKIFDAFAVGAVPLYVASPAHRIHDIVDAGAYLNLFGLGAAEAAARITSFAPDRAFAEGYLEAQHRLAELFSRPGTLVDERRRVVREVVRALENLGP